MGLEMGALGVDFVAAGKGAGVDTSALQLGVVGAAPLPAAHRRQPSALRRLRRRSRLRHLVLWNGGVG